MRSLLVCLFACLTASAAPKSAASIALAVPAKEPASSFTTNGHFEGGIAGSFGGSATRGLQWLVDDFELHNGYSVSDSTKLTVIHGFAANNVSALRATGRAQDSSSFFSPAAISTSAATATTAAGGLTYHVREAYLAHRFSPKFQLSAGLIRNVFGLENLVDRYQIATYYYSRAYSLWQSLGWNYTVGAKFELAGLELTFFQALDGTGANRPSLAARYKIEIKKGDWSLTPVLSVYAGKFFKGPKDLGVSAGLLWRRQNLFFNFEGVFGQRLVLADGSLSSRDWSLILEPGAELGFATLSVKGELSQNRFPVGATDFNAGVAVAKTFDRWRAKLLYAHNNLKGDLGVHANELRLLFGTEW